MPKAQSQTQTTQGAMETAVIMLLSDAVKQFQAKQLTDAIIILVPDTGKAKFSGSHLIASGKSAGKMSKATFVVTELGSSFAGESVPYCQANGDVQDLPLSIKLSIVAQPPNREGTTIAEALNHKPALVEAPKTGTNG